MSKCNFCQKDFSNNSSLGRHKKTNLECIEIQKSLNLEVKQILFKCEYCSKTYNQNFRLTTHLKKCKNKLNMDDDLFRQKMQAEVEQLRQQIAKLVANSSTNPVVNSPVKKGHNICIEETCNITASYNYKHQKKRLYCENHKKDGMINIINKMCISCDLSNGNKKYDGYCCRCYMHIFPDKPISRNYKSKERAVVDFIKFKFPNQTWIWNKSIQGGCSSRQPDLLCDLGYQVIIIEIDENQHEIYSCNCENKRLMLLSQDVGHRPLIVIRFNPDEYINQEGDLIPSCWTIENKTKILRVSSHNSQHWKNRLEVLQQHIDYWLDETNKTNKIIEVIQLYYNQN